MRGAAHHPNGSIPLQTRRSAPRAAQGLMALVVLLGALLLPALAARAHEATMAVITLREIAPGRYLGQWTMPPADITLQPIFPSQCRWTPPELDCGKLGLVGPVSFMGLGVKQSVATIKVVPHDGPLEVYTVTAAKPFATASRNPGTDLAVWRELADTYVNLGIDHILRGIDHLLFVLGLIWLVKGGWKLVKTITAFTVGHSISLALATFGIVGVPEQPLNAAIALSIVFVGVEIVKLQRGEEGLTVRHPWSVAFAFGLLHGLGFASALTALGIPQSTLPIALFFFNVGVEIGQLTFVMVVLALMWAHRQAKAVLPRWSAVLPAYVIGSVASYWFLLRI